MPVTPVRKMNPLTTFRKYIVMHDTNFPVYNINRALDLLSQQNGRLDPVLLRKYTDHLGRGGQLHHMTYRRWMALVFLCELYTAEKLAGTSSADFYRTYSQQLSAFLHRNTTTVLPGRPMRFWSGQWWYLKEGMAGVSTPGSSNHGWAGAIDMGFYYDGADADDVEDDVRRTTSWLRQMIPLVTAVGMSWESTEDWHIRDCDGSVVGPGLQQYELIASKPVVQEGSTGSYVREVQEAVGAGVDGQFGPKTKAKVMAFQESKKAAGMKGMDVDGVVGKQTWWAIEEDKV